MKPMPSKFDIWKMYYSAVSTRIHFDRGFISGLFMVGRIYLHFLRHKITAARHNPNNVHAFTLAFHPHPAGPWYTIWMALQTTQIKVISSIERADIIFHFDDNTHTKTALENTKQIHINSKINDISKTHVGRVFETIFGYPLSVDPLNYQGLAVCKSDTNGTHDGFLVKLPIQTEAVKHGSVYQRLVDSTFDGKRSEDLRIAYVLGEITLVYHKYKALNQRFSTNYLKTDICAARDVFSASEIDQIINFCDAIGLEFGAIDAMRDKVSGRLYLVDVNKTCMPVLSLKKPELLDVMNRIGHALEKGLQQRISKAPIV